MKFVVIDIETTGLDHLVDSVLSIGAILEDTEKVLPFEELPKFHVAINHEKVHGSLFAINMNKHLISNIVRYNTVKTDEERAAISQDLGMEFLKESEVAEKFFHWLIDCGLLKNWDTSLDGTEYLNPYKKIVNGRVYPMLTREGFSPLSFTAAGKNFSTFDKRFLEEIPNWKTYMKTRQRVIDPAILYVDWKNDEVLPDLGTCKERAGLPKHISHNALEDAWDTLQVLRKFYK